MKKIMLFSAAIMTAAVFFTACNTAPKKIVVSELTTPRYQWGNISGETIEIWGDESDLKRPYLKRVFENYEAATGNTIKIVVLSKDDINEKVPDVFNQKDAKKPDVLLSYGGTNIENLNVEENFYDFTNAPWVDDLTDTALSKAVFNGKIVGLPYGESSVSGTLYNKDVFEKYNIKVPKTQDEFMAVCEQLLKAGITPMYLPYAEITMLLYQFPLDTIVEDQAVLDMLNDGRLSYAKMPKMRVIIDWYKTMADRGYFGKDYINNNWDNMDSAMQSKEYAMMLCWDTWIYTSFTGDTESLGLMPAFMGTPEAGCFEGPNIVMALVNKHSENLDVTFDLINFMADPCNYNESYDGLYTAPIFKNQYGSITTPQYVEIERLIERLYYKSTAWSGIRGFAQIDARFIQGYMQNEYDAKKCLKLMDDARLERAANQR